MSDDGEPIDTFEGSADVLQGLVSECDRLLSRGDRAEVVVELRRLWQCTPRMTGEKGRTEEIITAYADELQNVSIAALANAVSHMIRTVSYFPAVGAICRQVDAEAHALRRLRVDLRAAAAPEQPAPTSSFLQEMRTKYGTRPNGEVRWPRRFEDDFRTQFGRDPDPEMVERYRAQGLID